MENKNEKTTNRSMLTGMFSDRDSAENAYRVLRERGYSDNDVNLMMSDETRKKYFSDKDSELGNKAMEGAGKGSAIGGTLGAIIGAVAEIGTSVLIPGLGLVIAGPLAVGLAAAGAGGAAGGLIGALIGSGIPEDRARKYESGVKDGRIVMGVHPRSEEDAQHIEREWIVSKGEEVYR